MVPAIGRAMSARHHTAQAGSKAQVADVYHRPANQDRIAQGALSAVRYAGDDDCPAGCGHPEPAVLARRHSSGF